MAIRKFRSCDNVNDAEFKKLEIDSKLYSSLKSVVYLIALINYKNINVWALLIMIPSVFSIIETMQMNKYKESDKNKK